MKINIDVTKKCLEKTRVIHINSAKFQIEIEFCYAFAIIAVTTLLLLINAGLLGYYIGLCEYK
jgi:hypothetical protein